MQLTSELLAAAADARYLLERGYPRELVLKVTGDRYRLPAGERNLLRRGVFGPSEAQKRKSRLLGWEALQDRPLGIDGHNLLITLESALGGGELLQADDGCVRDIAALGRNHRPGRLTRQAARLMVSALAGAGTGQVSIYLDAPLPKSGELAAELRGFLREAGLSGQAQAVPVPEHYLKTHQGPVASSDSALLDAVEQPLDLAGLIIRDRLNSALLTRLEP